MKFPNEGKAYRTKRAKLLREELALRRHVEKVAAARRRLPLGGKVPEDYRFDSEEGSVRMSELFRNGDTLVAYSFMYGPSMAKPCPMCSSFLDGLNGNAKQISQRTNFVVIAKSPLPRILEFTKARGWNNLRLLSSAGNSYNLDYRGEDGEGSQWPMMNVFVRRKGVIRHSWASELMGAKEDPGQNARHNDLMWPLWNLLDLTPQGRGAWYPPLEAR